MHFTLNYIKSISEFKSFDWMLSMRKNSTFNLSSHCYFKKWTNYKTSILVSIVLFQKIFEIKTKWLQTNRTYARAQIEKINRTLFLCVGLFEGYTWTVTFHPRNRSTAVWLDLEIHLRLGQFHEDRSFMQKDLQSTRSGLRHTWNVHTNFQIYLPGFRSGLITIFQ